MRTLTPDDVRSLWHYEPETGVLTWRVAPTTRVPAGSAAGSVTKSKAYLVVGFGYRLWAAHRLAWVWMTGAWPAGEIDHLNRDKLDNRWANLRDVTKSVNQSNVGPRKTNTSGYKGVSLNKANRRFQASIQKDGRHRHLGYFDEPQDAAAAYAAAHAELFGSSEARL